MLQIYFGAQGTCNVSMFDSSLFVSLYFEPVTVERKPTVLIGLEVPCSY